MTPQRWRRIDALLSAALQCPEEARASFLARACEGDEELRTEVQRLLSARQAAGRFTERPPSAAEPVQPSAASSSETFHRADATDPFAGRVLSHYRIEARLGSGGMGIVYRATDLKLGRAVAVKLLSRQLATSEDAKARFLREARTASALDHPNIGAIYELGEHDGELFIAMALYEGQSLKQRLERGPLPLSEALGIFRQIASGLEAAHRAGIVHRDVKPANVIVTSSGTVKILDFGLAKLVLDSPVQTLTDAERVLGTLLYMSPEQLRGKAVDCRTDLWSLGVLGYELVAGVSPFRAESSAATVNRILNEEPASLATVPGVSKGFSELISQLLRKDPAERLPCGADVIKRLGEEADWLVTEPRHQRAREMPAAGEMVHADGRARARRSRRGRALGAAGALAALLALAFSLNLGKWQDRVLGRSSGGVRSLAVLPLENFSADPQQEYLCDGMTEALTADLSQIGALRVVSRTSVMQYKQARKALKEIARALNVDLVVEGSVVRAGSRVRVTAQLIDAATDRHLWAKSYEREFSDVVALERDIARAVAQEIRVSVTPGEQARLANVHPVNPEAHEAYLLGRYLWNKRTEAGLKQALEYFQRSLEKDPAYAPAYAGIAATYNLLQFYAGFSPHTVFPQARAAAHRALELDESLAEAHAALAYVVAYYDWDWTSAEREYQRALELNPNGAEVYQSYGRLLAARGRVDEALVNIKRAQERNPLPLTLKANEAILLYFARRNQQAIEQLRKILELDSNFAVAHWGLGLAHEQAGAYSDAVAELQKASALSDNPMMKASLGHTYAAMGDRPSAQRVLEELNERAKHSYVPSYYAATIYAGLGEKEQAFEWLGKAYQEHSTLMTYLKMDPRFDPLRSDPRFSDLLRRVGFASR